MKGLPGCWFACHMLAVPMLTTASDRKGCDLVNFSAEVLAKFPNAKKACLDVEEKDGGIYAHYRANVVAVDADAVTVHMINHEGKAVSEGEVRSGGGPDGRRWTARTRSSPTSRRA